MWVTLTDSQRSWALLGNITVERGTWAFHPRNTRTRNFQDDFYPGNSKHATVLHSWETGRTLELIWSNHWSVNPLLRRFPPCFSVKSSIKVVLSYSIKPVRNLTLHFISLGQSCKLGAYSWIKFLSRSIKELFIGKCGFGSSFWFFCFYKANPSARVKLTCRWKLMH